MSDDLYKVVGSRAINGVEPGGTTTLDPDQVNIPALIAAGHVEPVVKTSRSKPTTIKSKGVTEDDGLQHDGRDGSGK
jgi:hypothetical protein